MLCVSIKPSVIMTEVEDVIMYKWVLAGPVQDILIIVMTITSHHLTNEGNEFLCLWPSREAPSYFPKAMNWQWNLCEWSKSVTLKNLVGNMIYRNSIIVRVSPPTTYNYRLYFDHLSSFISFLYLNCTSPSFFYFWPEVNMMAAVICKGNRPKISSKLFHQLFIACYEEWRTLFFVIFVVLCNVNYIIDP